MLSHAGAARFAFNAGLAHVKAGIEAGEKLDWSYYALVRWYPSSKTCSKCGAVKAKLSLAERVYRCDGCGLVMDRDLNAAANIKVAGSAPETVNARGGDTSRADTTSGNANPTETRTKQPPTSGMRLGAGLGNETMRF